MEQRNGVKSSAHDAAVVGALALIAGVVLVASEAVFNWIKVFQGWIS